ncbi:MAG: hypothetical protein EWM72_02350 [Nitrospira sp.]|nr:MAG: hypothetical protein EWM72_02350 [Nitrospira sp.]
MNWLTCCRCLEIIILCCVFVGLPPAHSPRFASAAQIETAQHHLDQGAALFRQGELKAAEDSAKKAIQLNPSSAQSHHLLGMILFKNRKPVEEAAAFAYAIKLEIAREIAHVHV